MTCQRSAGTVKVFEGLLLRVKVIVARKTKTPELPDRDTDTCRHQRLRLQPETSNKSPRNDLLAARSRWQNEAHEVVVIAPRAACKYEIVTCTNSAGISLRLIDRSRDVLASPLCFDNADKGQADKQGVVRRAACRGPFRNGEIAPFHRTCAGSVSHLLGIRLHPLSFSC